MKKYLSVLLIVLCYSIITQAQNEKTFEFRVEGMTCESCANAATQALLNMKGVTSASVDFKTKTAKVTGKEKVTKEQIKETIAGKNFEVLFEGESLTKSLTEEEINNLDIEVIKGGKKITIKEHIKEGKITVFDFYADWCGPCKVFSPKVERLIAKYPDLVLKKVDIVDWKSEISKQLTKEYQLPSLPFILIFDDKAKLLGKVSGNYIEKVEEVVKKNLK